MSTAIMCGAMVGETWALRSVVGHGRRWRLFFPAASTTGRRNADAGADADADASAAAAAAADDDDDDDDVMTT